MQELKSTCESTVALAQMDFYCKVTDIFSQYTAFFNTLLRAKQSEPKPSQSMKSEEMSLKSFSDSKKKELMESFKKLQRVVLEKVKELEEMQRQFLSVSLDFSEESHSPKTPPTKSDSIFFKTPQGFNLERPDKLASKLKTQCTQERRSRIKQLSRTQSVKRCLFKN